MRWYIYDPTILTEDIDTHIPQSYLTIEALHTRGLRNLICSCKVKQDMTSPKRSVELSQKNKAFTEEWGEIIKLASFGVPLDLEIRRREKTGEVQHRVSLLERV